MGDRASAALAARVRELLEPSTFAVDEGDGSITVRLVAGHHGGSVLRLGTSGLVQKLPLPANLKAQMFAQNTAASLQEFVSKATGRDWPAAGAKPQAKAIDGRLHVWYGDRDEGTAALSWRPFEPGELG